MSQIQGNQMVYNESNGELTMTGKGITFTGAGDLDMSGSTGTFKTPTGAQTIAGDITLAANKGITATTGTGAVDFSSATGTFKTSTGTNTLGGNVAISGSKTFTSGTGAVALNGDTTVATAKTLAVTDADKLTVGSIIVPQRVMVRHGFNASSVDDWAFIADRAYTVVSVKEVHSVAGNDGGTVQLMVRKVTDASAPGAAAGTTVKEFLSGALNLKSTANTVVTGSLTATGADLNLAAGDKIGCDFIGVLTTLAGGVVIIELKAI